MNNDNKDTIKNSAVEKEKFKETKSNRIKIILLAICIVLITGISVFGPKVYKSYKNRHLLRAEAQLQIDDIKGAITSYRSHMLENPSDYHTLLELAKLLEKSGERDSADRIIANLYDNPSLNKDIKKKVIRYKHSLLWDEAKKYSNEIDILISQKKYEEAIPILNNYIDLTFKQFRLHSELISLENNSEIAIPLGFQNIISVPLAKLHYAKWKAGNLSDAELIDMSTAIPVIKLMSTYFPKVEYSLSDFEDSFQNLNQWLHKEANDAFDSKLWKDSTKLFFLCYRLSQISSKEENFSVFSPAEDLYNSAVADYNREYYSDTLSKLDTLTAEHPDKMIDQVKSLRKSIRKNRVYFKYNNLFKDAGKDFENKQWASAAAGYENAANYLIKNGYKVTSNQVAINYYNKAMAYRNSGRYCDSLNELRWLRSFTKYEQSLVEEQIRSLEKDFSYWLKNCTYRKVRENK